MKYNKAQMMKNAWEMARKDFAKKRNTCTLRELFAYQLRKEWIRVKGLIARAIERASYKKPANQKTPVLASTANNGGKSWICEWFHVLKFDLHPDLLGSEICYDYK